MSKKGRHLFKGINSQSWAAMSLFLQYLRKSDFRYIGFEGEKLEDFHLVFNDGHKIICESKAWDKELSYPDLRGILNKVEKHDKLNPPDEILIICKNFNKKLKREIDYFKFYERKLKQKFIKEKGFTEKQVPLLSQVKIWEVTEDINIKAVKILLTEILDIWIPNYRLRDIVNSLIVNEIYFGSEKGKILFKEEFLERVKDKEKEIANESKYYKEKKDVEKEISQIIRAIEKPESEAWAIPPISSLTSKPDFHHFILDRFKKKGNKINLKNWDMLWKASSKGIFSTSVFEIFKNNIDSKKNKNYLINFLPKLLEEFPGFYGQQFIVSDIVEICEDIIMEVRCYDREVFNIIKQLILAESREYFYVKTSRTQRERWERQKISEILKQLYDKSNDDRLKKNIIRYITNTFNLVMDDGDFWEYTPPSIFNILEEYGEEDIREKIPELTEIFVRHYKEFYNNLSDNLQYKGWDHFGLGTMGFGPRVYIKDKFYIRTVLTPVLKEYYRRDRENAWNFIIKSCISCKESEVSLKKPDFLNRAIIDILIEEYSSGTHKTKALNILLDFIKMKRGIPDKANLIFYKVRDSNLSKDKKWKLIKKQTEIKRFKNLPANIYVEQILSELIASGNREALEMIEMWTDDQRYFDVHWREDFDIVNYVPKLLENKDTFQSGVDILRKYLSSNRFVLEIGRLKAYEISLTVADLIEKDVNEGIKVLKEINQKTDLSVNQQIAVCNSIGNISKDNISTLLRIYREFLQPVLKDSGDIEQLEGRFNDRNSRSYLVGFAENLAKAKKFKESLLLTEFFIEDPDPPRDGSNYANDSKGVFNYHQRVKNGEDVLDIATVRGKCAWVLQKFCNIKGRNYAKKIIPLVDSLAKDPNFYVRLQAAVPLTELSKLRHSIMPKNINERFLPLRTAKNIERIAFDMLEDKKNHSLNAVMRRLAIVFSYMHSISTVRAKRVIKTFLNTEFNSVIEEIIPLLIFFSEFRKDAFKEERFRNLYGEEKWEKINEFNSKPFQKMLKQLVLKSSKEVKMSLARNFQRLPKENIDLFEQTFDVSFNYLSSLANSYEVRVFHDIYNFIEEYINKKFNKCYKLWKKCIKEERTGIKKMIETGYDPKDMVWWPYYKNSDILLKILEEKGKEEFLEWLEYLADYPEGIDVSIKEAVKKLASFKEEKETVFRIFNILLEKRSVKYIDLKPKWLEM